MWVTGGSGKGGRGRWRGDARTCARLGSNRLGGPNLGLRQASSEKSYFGLNPLAFAARYFPPFSELSCLLSPLPHRTRMGQSQPGGDSAWPQAAP